MSLFQRSRTFKLSNYQTFKLSNSKIFQLFKPSKFEGTRCLCPQAPPHPWLRTVSLMVMMMMMMMIDDELGADDDVAGGGDVDNDVFDDESVQGVGERPSLTP